MTQVDEVARIEEDRLRHSKICVGLGDKGGGQCPAAGYVCAMQCDIQKYAHSDKSQGSRSSDKSHKQQRRERGRKARGY